MQWEFFNLQPLGNLEEDCVNRAISLATGRDYYEINHQLKLVSQLFQCPELCVCCYKHLLDYVYGFKRIEAVQGMKVKDFLRRFYKGTYLIRVEGHLTCGIDGVIYDTWDCGNAIVDIVWLVSN